MNEDFHISEENYPRMYKFMSKGKSVIGSERTWEMKDNEARA